MSKTSREKLLEETKMQIRSVIQSHKGELTLRKVQLDFQNFVGITIPYRELGYSSIEGLFQSIPDVVHCHYAGPSLMCSAIADEKTKHIEELVGKQRSQPRNGRDTSSFRPRNIYYSWETSHYARSQPWGDGRPTLTARRFNSSSYNNQWQPSYNSAWQNSNSSCGWASNDWRSASNQNYSKSSSEENYYKSSSEQSYSKTSSNQNYTKNTNQNNSKPLSVQNSTNIPTIRKETPPITLTRINTNDKVSVSKSTAPEQEKKSNESSSKKVTEVQRTTSEKKICDTKKTELDPVYRFLANARTESSAKTSSNERLAKETAATKPKSNVVSDSYVRSEQRKIESQEKWDDYACYDGLQFNSQDAEEIEPISKRLKEEFFQLLERQPKGIWANDLPHLYEKEFKKKFDYEELGYISLADLIAAVPNVFTTYRPQPTADWLLFDARKDNREIISSLSCEASKKNLRSYHVSDHFKKKLIQVLNCSQEGVLISDINYWFKSYFGCDIPYDDFGFSSINDLIDHLVDDVISLEKTSAGYVIKRLPEANFCFGPALNSKDKGSDMMRLIPADAAIKCTIQLQQLPSGVTRNSCFAVTPSHIYGPNCFYVQLRGEATTLALQHLMDELEETYTSRDADLYKVPEKYLASGLICAAVYQYENGSGSDWHRAIITSVVKDDVEVDFFDYGTKAIVKASSIRFLKNEFTTLHAQAREAKLGNIEPMSNREWSELARKEFFEAVGEKELMAQLIGITVNPVKNTPVLSLCLIDTCQPDGKDVDINKLLVDNGLAQFIDEFSNDVRSTCPNMYYRNPMEWLAQSMMFNQWAMNQPYLQSMMPNLAASMNMMPQAFKAPFSNPFEYIPANMSSATTLSQQIEKGTESDYQQGIKESPDKELNNSKDTSTEVKTAQRPQEENLNWTSKDTAKDQQIKAEPNQKDDLSDTDDVDQLNRELEQFTMSKKRFVKKTTLVSKYTVHLILHNGELHLTSKEVSSFFWEHDLVKNKLRIHGIKVPFQLVNESEDPELYHELVAHKLCGTTGQQLGVTIYPIKFVGKIIDAFNKELVAVKEAVAHELDKFDPNDSYWGNSDDGISIGNASDELEDGIELALEVLRHRKCTVQNQLRVEEKHFLREELGLLNERISMLEKELK